jgi:hypothetical protein
LWDAYLIANRVLGMYLDPLRDQAAQVVDREEGRLVVVLRVGEVLAEGLVVADTVAVAIDEILRLESRCTHFEFVASHRMFVLKYKN